MSRRAAVVVALVLAFVPASVSASPRPAASGSAEQRAQAEALFLEGKALGEAGQIREACARFEESQALDPALGTLLHLAACYEMDGLTASAWGAFQAAAELAESAEQTERAELARARAAKLEKTLSRIVIRLDSPVAGMQVALDGRVLGRGSLGSALPVDPGTHHLEATARGRTPWHYAVEIPADRAVRSEVRIPELEAVPEKPPAPAPAPVPPAPETKRPRWPGYVVGAAGLVALGIGGYFGALAARQQRRADEHCDGSVCTQEGLDKHADANRSAWIANVGVGLGLVGIGTGTYLIVSRRPEAASPASGMYLQLRGAF